MDFTPSPRLGEIQAVLQLTTDLVIAAMDEEGQSVDTVFEHLELEPRVS